MPWTLGSEVHVDNLHAGENVHIDGSPISLSTLTTNLLGAEHGIGIGAMHFDPSTNQVTYSTTGSVSSALAFLTSIFTSSFAPFGKIERSDDTVLYMPPDFGVVNAVVGALQPNLASGSQVGNADIIALNGAADMSNAGKLISTDGAGNLTWVSPLAVPESWILLTTVCRGAGLVNLWDTPGNQSGVTLNSLSASNGTDLEIKFVVSTRLENQELYYTGWRLDQAFDRAYIGDIGSGFGGLQYKFTEAASYSTWPGTPNRVVTDWRWVFANTGNYGDQSSLLFGAVRVYGAGNGTIGADDYIATVWVKTG